MTTIKLPPEPTWLHLPLGQVHEAMSYYESQWKVPVALEPIPLGETKGQGFLGQSRFMTQAPSNLYGPEKETYPKPWVERAQELRENERDVSLLRAVCADRLNEDEAISLIHTIPGDQDELEYVGRRVRLTQKVFDVWLNRHKDWENWEDDIRRIIKNPTFDGRMRKKLIAYILGYDWTQREDISGRRSHLDCITIDGQNDPEAFEQILCAWKTYFAKFGNQYHRAKYMKISVAHHISKVTYDQHCRFCREFGVTPLKQDDKWLSIHLTDSTYQPPASQTSQTSQPLNDIAFRTELKDSVYLSFYPDPMLEHYDRLDFDRLIELAHNKSLTPQQIEAVVNYALTFSNTTSLNNDNEIAWFFSHLLKSPNLSDQQFARIIQETPIRNLEKAGLHYPYDPALRKRRKALERKILSEDFPTYIKIFFDALDRGWTLALEAELYQMCDQL